MNEWLEKIVLRRACVLVAAGAGAFVVRHGFHHWGINVTIQIDNPELADALELGFMVGVSTLHHYACRVFPWAAEWL